MNDPFISICIPAYKHPEFLMRLLNFILIQNFKDFEVIITYDSPDNSVGEMINHYLERIAISYTRNAQPLGTPANWNEAIRHARGHWIKLMHDDDWFSDEGSLQLYIDAIKANPKADFIFSAYRNVSGEESVDLKIPDQLPKGSSEPVIRPEGFRMRQLKINPTTLLSKNIIGPPSVVTHKNDKLHFYDTSLKWLVDIDFYIRYLNEYNVVFIDKPLINIGINPLQVTKSSSLVREVEIPEHFRILEKTGIKNLENLLVYDAWWRLFRNLKILSTAEIAMAGYNGPIPGALINIIKFQSRFPYRLLKFGPAAKVLMMASYLHNKLSGNFRQPEIV